jgi:NhaP-type Na+/H+ or K+/H+ antiporter
MPTENTHRASAETGFTGLAGLAGTVALAAALAASKVAIKGCFRG